jgi:hypothetical protein
MQRHQLLELHEQPWCPCVLRNALTDILQKTIRLMRVYDPALPMLEQAFADSGARRILDLCSGAGGPWIAWQARGQLPPGFRVSLSDLFPPPLTAVGLLPPLDYVPTPVDARHIQPSPGDFRTLFTAIHHFRPPDVEAILADAVADGQPIAIFEFTWRSIPAAAFLLGTPLMVWFLTLQRPPRSLLRWLLTFLLPAIPLLVMVDGIVSCLRSYGPNELRAMACRAAPEGFTWTAGTTRGVWWPLPITYLIGIPAPRRPVSARHAAV